MGMQTLVTGVSGYVGAALVPRLVRDGHAVRGFARRRPDVRVTMVRAANVIGPHVTSPLTSYFRLPVIPTVAGFDPRLQFLLANDLIAALTHGVVTDVGGTFNVAGDGVLLLSQAVDTTRMRTELGFEPAYTTAAAFEDFGREMTPSPGFREQVLDGLSSALERGSRQARPRSGRSDARPRLATVKGADSG